MNLGGAVARAGRPDGIKTGTRMPAAAARVLSASWTR